MTTSQPALSSKLTVEQELKAIPGGRYGCVQYGKPLYFFFFHHYNVFIFPSSSEVLWSSSVVRAIPRYVESICTRSDKHRDDKIPPHLAREAYIQQRSGGVKFSERFELCILNGRLSVVGEVHVRTATRRNCEASSGCTA